MDNAIKKAVLFILQNNFIRLGKVLELKNESDITAHLVKFLLK